MPLSALTVSPITSESQAMPSAKRRPTRNDGSAPGSTTRRIIPQRPTPQALESSAKRGSTPRIPLWRFR
jgi:hypothetical protein